MRLEGISLAAGHKNTASLAWNGMNDHSSAGLSHCVVSVLSIWMESQ